MADTPEPVVIVENLTKHFKIPLESSSGIKQKLINALKGRKGYREFTPLKSISFTVNRGDFFGIVGRNGSGKSTLLKTLAGIYNPDEGQVHVNGKLVPFIELGVGFNPELTGRENVFLNGALLGFSRREMESMYDEIVDFAELHDFMEERLKNYSSGMQVRLAFSIAIRAKGDVLLLDEVLAVGDEAFQQKCYRYFSSLKHEKRTVILVSHDMAAIEKFCNKAVLLENGHIVKMGSSREIGQMYSDLFTHEIADDIEKENAKQASISGIKHQSLKSVNFSVTPTIAKDTVVALEPFAVQVEIISAVAVPKAGFSISIVNSQGVVVISAGAGGQEEVPLLLKEGKNVIEFVIQENILNDDTYAIDAIMEYYTSESVIAYQKTNAAHFSVKGIKLRKHALTHPRISVKVE
ncbi:MAG TPA: polysaccharide ABC transporter ATP-binding protein [Verrucomicrobiae bacterium]|nr:polysaccharide ABC transporter ATP-binding protein [Verrucomicrobiae bacterium]